MKRGALEDRIHRYLLGDLPDEEQSSFEQEFMADGERFEQVWAAENELIDRYVRGGLTVAQKHLFEVNYLASPVHRERLDLAKKLIQAADSDREKEKAGFAAAHPRSRWSSLLTAWSANRWRWAVVGAVALFAVSSVWLFTENLRLRDQINRLRQQEAREQQRSEELEEELKAQREQSDKLDYLRENELPPIDPQTAEPRTLPEQGESQPAISFLLSPLLIRGDGEAQELKIPKETEAVLLKMRVQESIERSLQVSLRTVEGVQIWSRSGIKFRPQEKNGSIVSVSIPANKIPAGDYVLTLSALNEANEPEEINRYFFRLSKQ
jgi:hypothetical protein